MTDWRSIPCRNVCWTSVVKLHGATWRRLKIRCRKPSDPPKPYIDEDEGCWYEWTLGDLADAGERSWNGAGIGAVTIEAIKLTIDAAAAGVDVTANSGAYVPRPYSPPRIS